MKCVSCGSENYPGARFCQICGQPLIVAAGEGAAEIRPDQIPCHYAQQVETSSGVVSMRTEKFLWRLFGGVSWLMVSIGTFLVASGYLGVIDSTNDYYASPINSFKMIGYGIVVYAIAAIFVALNRFVKSR